MAQPMSTVRWLGRATLDLLFPPRCAGCGRHGSFLCDVCTGELIRASPPRCPRCWRPGAGGRVCAECEAEPPAFDGLRSAFVYDGRARDLIHALKFRGTSALAAPMGSMLADAARAAGWAADVVIPVPLSGRRRRERGYNQAEAMGRKVAAELHAPLRSRALERTRHAAPQARSADAEERRRNVAGAFSCRETDVAGLRVLLVDDVTTTGATLAACATALKEAGAHSVWALTFARED